MGTLAAAPRNQESPPPSARDQIEISSPLGALDDMGRPVNFGWARQPLWNYDPALLRAPARRFDASDRYLIQAPGFIICFQIFDSGASGYVGITIISLKEKKRSTQIHGIPFSLGSPAFPHSSETGKLRVQKKKYFIEFSAMEGGARIIKVDFPKYGRHRFLRGELVLAPPEGAESLVCHSPWLKDRNAFTLLRRSPWYAVEGIMQFGAQEIFFPQGRSWGIYEWSRGVRPRSDIHYQAYACGTAGGNGIHDADGIHDAGSGSAGTGGESGGNLPEGVSSFGISVGYGGADAGAGTENAVFLDGKLHKLDQVTFHILPSSWTEPWRFTSSDKRLEMTFSPLQERVERRHFFFQSLHRRQFFGSFSGRVILDDGSPLEFSGIPGMAERRKSIN